MKKRYLSGILLALAVLIGLFPTVAMAAGPGNEHVLTVDDVEFDVQNKSITRYIGDAEYIKIPEKIGDNRVRQLHVNYGNPSGAFMNAGLKGVAFEAAPEVGSIPLYSFKNNPSLEYAHLPEGIERIEYEAFAECPSLRTVTLPSTLKTIGNYGFHQCKIENLSLPEGLETIGRCAISCVSGDGPNGVVVIPSTMKKLSSAALMMPDEAQTYFFKSPKPLLPFYRFWATVDAEGNLIEGTKPLTFLVPAGSKLNYLGSLLAAYPEPQIPVRPLNFEEGPDVLLEWYLVTFDAGEGTSAPEEQIVIEGNKALPPDEPTKEGYAFLGWYDDADNKFDFATPIKDDTELTAKWNEFHTVTFDAGEGGTPKTQTKEVTSGETVTAPSTVPKKVGYSFHGWNDSTGKAFDFTTEITEDTTLTAEWELKTYEVKFLDHNGDVYPEMTIENVLHGSAVSAPATDPTEDGYAFDGWNFDFSTLITADTNIASQWTKLHTVSFELAGGTPAQTAQEIRNGEKASDPDDPTRDGYEFDGWFATGATEPFNFDNAPTGDLALTAKWTKLHTVTFDVAGGDTATPDTQIVRDNTKVKKQPEPPTKENYEFLGWYDDAGNKFNFATPIKADTTLTARWKQVKFSVSGYVWYDDGDGLHGDSHLGGVPGVYVKILDTDGRRIAWTKTDADGCYSFEGLEAGTYTIQFYNIPRGCRIAPSYVGDDPTVDSNGLKQKIYLTEDDPHHDLGLLKQTVRSTRRR